MKRSHQNSNSADSGSESDELPELAEEPSFSGTPKTRKDKKSSKRTTQPQKVNVKKQLSRVFSRIGEVSAGDYVVHGELKDAPIISVRANKCDRGMSFPLDQKTAEDLTSVFSQSPYGLGEKTVVDQKFRKSLQLDPKDFMILNPAWENFIRDTLVNKIKTSMDIKEIFDAKLYKLLLYTPGSFFKRHKDSEKENGMFGTLVVQLPSCYIGGELVVYHANESKTVDLSSKNNIENGFKTHFAAFYADCEHEILPVEKGIRVCLIYNLVLRKIKGQVAALVPPPPLPFEQQVISVITEWKKNPDDPPKLIYGLSHQYTEKHLFFENLKPKDKPIAALLQKLCNKLGISCFLATFHKHTSIESSEITRNMENSGDEEDIDAFIEREVNLQQLSSIHVPHQGAPEIKQLPCNITVDFEEEVITKDLFSKAQSVSQMPTGNEGVKKELRYQHTALVIFPIPTDRLFNFLLDITNHESFNGLVKIFLEQYFACRHQYSQSLILEMVKKLIEKDSFYADKDKLFEALNELKDLELTKMFLKKYRLFKIEPVAQIVQACESFGWKHFSEEIQSIFKDRLVMSEILKLEALEGLIGQTEMDYDQKQICKKIFKMLLDSNIEQEREENDYSTWRNFPKVEFDRNQKKKDYLLVVFRLGKKLNFDFSDFACAQPIKALIPVLMPELKSKPENEYQDCLKKIGKYITTLLESVKIKPAKALSWARNDYPNCSCPRCVPVRTFMKSGEKVLRLKICKEERYHIHQKLEWLNNITHETERVGSPYTLVITKIGNSNNDIELHRLAKNVLPDLKAALASLSPG